MKVFRQHIIRMMAKETGRDSSPSCSPPVFLLLDLLTGWIVNYRIVTFVYFPACPSLARTLYRIWAVSARVAWPSG